MNIVIFEDKLVKFLSPFSINHASFELVGGMHSNIERFINIHGAQRIILIVRSEIKELIAEKYPEFEVNPEIIPIAQCFNGCIVINETIFKTLIKHKHISNQGQTLYYNNKQEININDFKDCINNYDSSVSVNSINEEIVSFKYLWDPIFSFKKLFELDIKDNLISNEYISDESVSMINKDNIFINNTARIKSGSILDGSLGPIVIGKNVTLDIGSLIQGPVYINDDSYISMGAKIKSNTYIGKNCKVGGEVSNCIFFKNSNKVHDGFLGHSFIGEWVNIGAGTNNSNLNNNYSTVKFDFGQNKNLIDTEKQFLGVMIGDYTRIGISAMINTGTYIGLGCNIYGHGYQKKYIPSFSWGNSNIVNLDKFLDTCKKVKERREQNLTSQSIKFLKNLYKQK